MATKRKQKGTGHKLSRAAQDWLLQAIAEYWKPCHIFDHLKEHFKIKSFTHQTLRYYRENHKEEIASRRKKYLDDFDSVDLAQKKVRVKEFVKKYDKLDEIPIDIATASTLDVIQRQQSLLGDIRKEMEPIDAKRGIDESGGITGIFKVGTGFDQSVREIDTPGIRVIIDILQKRA